MSSEFDTGMSSEFDTTASNKQECLRSLTQLQAITNVCLEGLKNKLAGVSFAQTEICVLSVLHIYELRKLTSMSWKLGTYRNVWIDRLTQLQAC
jgi:hypothetical protein